MEVMATLNEASRASKDADLIDRFEAQAAVAGVTNPRVWVSERMRRLVMAPISAAPDAQKIVDPYTFAFNRQREFLSSTTLALWSGEVMLPPGLNGGAVIDAYIAYAVEWVLDQEATSSQ